MNFQHVPLRNSFREFCFRLGKYSARCKVPNFYKAKCVVKSKLHNEPSVQAISKSCREEIAEVFHRPEGSALQETGAEFKIEVSILKDKATVFD